jgi:hypothetical protein
MQPVLGLVDFFGLTQDLPDQISIRAVLISIDASALIFVPSIVITPTDTRPASRHRPRTSSNNSSISRSCRRRNSAIVE